MRRPILSYIDPVDPFADSAKLDQLRELVGEMQADKVEALLVLNTNPIYDAPADLELHRSRRSLCRQREARSASRTGWGDAGRQGGSPAGAEHEPDLRCAGRS